MARARIRRRDKVFLVSAFAAVVFFSSVSIAVNALSADVPTSSNSTRLNPRVQDSTYVLRLGSATLPGMAQAEAISLGRFACDDLKGGGTGTALRALLAARGLTAEQRTKVIDAAVEAYCPGYRLQAQT